MPVTPEQYQRLRDLFHETSDLTLEDRTPRILAACAQDPVLHDAALRMLKIESHDSFDLLESAPAPNPTVPGYTISGLLGAGATGIVYRAEQHAPLRTVAIKLLRTSEQASRAAQRFAHEAEFLAKLKHPGIAHVYNAGVAQTPTGSLPYIAMEFIEGQPLTPWCHRKALDEHQRINLFIKICEAIQYAHQRGVIHRDLKPDNILVTDDGQPKILDFGVARSLDPSSLAPSGTLQGEIVGTLAYMSPEQATGSSGAHPGAPDKPDLDLRTDIYALGVILFELLADNLPLDLSGLPLPDAIDAIRSAPRTRLRTLIPHADPDLELIAQTAMHTDPDLRYQSAADLAADLRRYLARQPILARAPRMSYQLAKFAQRRRMALSIGATVAALLILASAVSITFAIAENRARRDASARSTETQAMLALLTEAMQAASPSGSGANYSLSEFLFDLSTQLDQGTEDIGPLGEAQLRTAIGQSLIDLGSPSEAIGQLQAAVDLRSQVLGPQHELTLDSQLVLAVAQIDTGDFDAAESSLDNLLPRCQEHLGEQHLTTLDTLYWVAALVYKQGNIEEALPYFEQLYHSQLAALGAAHDATLSTLSALALVNQRVGNLEAASDLSRECYRAHRDFYGDRDPATLVVRNNRALLLIDMGQLDEAEREFREILAIREDILPAHHRQIGVSLGMLGRVKRDQGAYDQAIEYCTRGYAVLLETLPPDHPYVRTTAGILASIYEALGDRDLQQHWADLETDPAPITQ